MNAMQTLVALWTLVLKEIKRFTRIWPQTLLPPSITMAMYFIIFGNLIGSRIGDMDGFSYMDFIVPGLIMLLLLTESISNASFGIYMPRYSGTIYELLSAPVSVVEVLLGYVGAAAKKSVILGLLVLDQAQDYLKFRHQSAR